MVLFLVAVQLGIAYGVGAGQLLKNINASFLHRLPSLLWSR